MINSHGISLIALLFKKKKKKGFIYCCTDSCLYHEATLHDSDKRRCIIAIKNAFKFTLTIITRC